MNYKVLPIKSEEAYDWLLYKHYARRIPSISYAYGLYCQAELIGICTFGTPASSTLLKGVCGNEYAEYVLELNRLCIINGVKNNALSYLVAHSLDKLPRPSIVVSYADTGQGHTGYIYQATNFIYTGLSSRFLDPKIKGLEHQHHATYAHGMTNKELREKYGDRLYFEERARKHRYIFFTGSGRQKRGLRKKLNYPILPYPKGDNKRYDASYKPKTQGILFS